MRYRLLSYVLLTTALFANPCLALGKWGYYVGLSHGGDSISDAYNQNAIGNADSTKLNKLTDSLQAGGLAHVALGYQMDITSSGSWIGRATVGWKFDSRASGTDNISFDRYPVELAVYHEAIPEHFFGFGIIREHSPYIDISLSSGSNLDVDLNTATGFALLYGWQVYGKTELGARYTNISYEGGGLNGSLDGSSIGMYVTQYFDR
ncbi:MAG: hypothetical protein H0W44_02985 [Gammaproteobacteria bacterium]|nr:hypothetical protein [Gammaproteobacteria bacterium]